MTKGCRIRKGSGEILFEDQAIRNGFDFPLPL